MLDGLRDEILTGPAVAYVLDRFQEETVKAFECAGDESDRLQCRRVELESEVSRLVAGLASGMHSPAIAGEIGKREREIGALTERLVASKPVSVRARVRAIRGAVMASLAELRGFLESDPIAVRPHLAQHIEMIDLHTDGPAIVAKGNWDLLGCIGWDGADGGNCTQRPSVPFIIGIAA
jgi:hypothetical protein